MNITNPSAAGLLGLLIGDALGVPCEFRPAWEIPIGYPHHLESFALPHQFGPSTHGQPPGTYSDDGAQTLALLDSLAECDGFDAVDFALRLRAWANDGRYAVDGRVFDIGTTTRAAILELNRGTDPLLSGRSDVHTNGSLMRTLSVSLFAFQRNIECGSEDRLLTIQKVAHIAHQQSRVTHAHVLSQVCCAVYSLVAMFLLEAKAVLMPGEEIPPLSSIEDIFARACNSLCEFYPAAGFMPAFMTELCHVIAALGLDIEISERHHIKKMKPGGTSFVLDTLAAAHTIIMGATSYRDAITNAIALGHDTDTTAAVVGGLAGILFCGTPGQIPSAWIEHLRGKSLIAPVLERLAS